MAVPRMLEAAFTRWVMKVSDDETLPADWDVGVPVHLGGSRSGVGQRSRLGVDNDEVNPPRRLGVETQQEVLVIPPRQVLALLNSPEMPPSSVTTPTTATTAIRPTRRAYSTMEAPRSVWFRGTSRVYTDRSETTTNPYLANMALPFRAPFPSTRFGTPSGLIHRNLDP
jgi:hypothetical protein